MVLVRERYHRSQKVWKLILFSIARRSHLREAKAYQYCGPYTQRGDSTQRSLPQMRRGANKIPGAGILHQRR
jgi:hypothetical protein